MTEDMNAPLDLPAKEADDLKRTMKQQGTDHDEL